MAQIASGKHSSISSDLPQHTHTLTGQPSLSTAIVEDGEKELPRTL